MKIYGSLFLWIPLSIFLIYLGLQNISDEVFDIIVYIVTGGVVLWNTLCIIFYLTDYSIRRDIETMVNDNDYGQIIITFLICPITILPIITHYLNNKLTIEI